MEILQDILTKNKEFTGKFDDCTEIIKQECDNYFKEIDLFLKTENVNFFKPINAGKENVEPAVVSNKRRGRSRKPALADITENNLPQTEVLTIKKEKISDIQENIEDCNLNVQIKREVEEMPAPTMLPPRKKKIKAEKLDLPKRSTRTRTKKADAKDAVISDHENTRITKGSDVVIQNTTITTIDISDSDKDTETDSDIEKTKTQTETRSTRSKMRKQNKPEPVALKQEFHDEEDTGIRSTRTKTKQKKRARSNSIEQPSNQAESKKSKSDSNTEQECNGTIQTEYEDALSLIENNQGKPQSADATYIASSKNSQCGNEQVIASGLNSTVVVENPKMVTKETKQSRKSPQKDEIPKTPPKSGNNKGTKQIFSPFEKTPLKKKVEAFERLGAESSGIPTRVTRTKKKTQKKNSEHEEETETKLVEEKNKKSYEKEKIKTLTPITYKFVPKVCSTSKINKLHPIYSNDSCTNNESILSVKSASALKASQAEFREREKRRQEKERDALRKREALLQAQTEEKRRKREEKQQKAQQQREILEKEKQKYLEAHRIKEEKFKQAMAEREEKLLKQKEEADKKRLMAKKKANELLKEKEEVIRMAEQKKYAEMKVALDKQGEMAKLALKQKMERAQQQSMAVYMATKPPLLPTFDCYDSDDPEYDSTKKIEPAWCRDRELREMQLAMITVGETIKNSYFCRQAQTPDLTEIFEIIDPRKLKRTSSAIWRKPPRYTLMPSLEDTIEFSEDSD